MSVLKHIKEETSQEEFEETSQEYIEETALLRTAMLALSNGLADEIRRIMEEDGISQNELQRRLKISSRTMNGIMHGNANPTFSTMIKLSAISGRMPQLIWK